ncbi:hypothetical protein GCM10027422_43770 [Hymenobacter arcticus]
MRGRRRVRPLSSGTTGGGRTWPLARGPSRQVHNSRVTLGKYFVIMGKEGSLAVLLAEAAGLVGGAAVGAAALLGGEIKEGWLH